MNTIKLNTTERTNDTSRVKGVVYGPDLEQNLVLEADYNELFKVVEQAGYNKIVTITVEGKDHEVLFKDFQYEPVTNNIGHFDMYAIKRGQKMRANIPVEFTGESPAVNKGAVLNQFVDEIEVECIPSKLPESFVVDISKLDDIGDAVSTDDIAKDEDVELLVDEHLTIARIEEVQELKVEDDGPIDEPSDDEDGESADGEESSATTDEKAETSE